MFTLKDLIYSKGFDLEIQSRLIQIADSPSWVEDLIDLVHELRDDTTGEGKRAEDLQREVNILEGDVEDLEEKVERLERELEESLEEKPKPLVVGGITCPHI